MELKLCYFFLIIQRVIIIRKPSVIKGRLYSHPKHKELWKSEQHPVPFIPLKSRTPVSACFFRFGIRLSLSPLKQSISSSTTSPDSGNKNTIARLAFGTSLLLDILTSTEGALAAFLQPLSRIMCDLADKYRTNENASIITVVHLYILEARLCGERLSI